MHRKPANTGRRSLNTAFRFHYPPTQRDFAESGLARLEYYENALQVAVFVSTQIGSQHISTARMAEIAQNSVVDSNGAVHGVKNLYCAGSAVFPTCGLANPTLAIVPVPVRLANHFKADLGRPRAGVDFGETETVA